MASPMSLKTGGFLGFSCFGGSKAARELDKERLVSQDAYNPKERSSFVEIKGLSAA